MYEYQSKPISSYQEVVDVCRKATSYFVGSFMLEMIRRRKEWQNPKTKSAFIHSFHNEYFAWDENCSIDRTRNRVNCVIRIIESRKVKEALEFVIDANDLKLGIDQAKENARITLKMIQDGTLEY